MTSLIADHLQPPCWTWAGPCARLLFCPAAGRDARPFPYPASGHKRRL